MIHKNICHESDAITPLHECYFWYALFVIVYELTHRVIVDETELLFGRIAIDKKKELEAVALCKVFNINSYAL